jgi:uncharacterized membrane protein YqhA
LQTGAGWPKYPFDRRKLTGTAACNVSMWLTIIHLAFVVSAFMLAYIDRLMGLAKGKKTEAVSP